MALTLVAGVISSDNGRAAFPFFFCLPFFSEDSQSVPLICVLLGNPWFLGGNQRAIISTFEEGEGVGVAVVVVVVEPATVYCLFRV